jgi:hypothetical protein
MNQPTINCKKWLHSDIAVHAEHVLDFLAIFTWNSNALTEDMKITLTEIYPVESYRLF